VEVWALETYKALIYLCWKVGLEDFE
jgi:hypothetical protein